MLRTSALSLFILASVVLTGCSKKEDSTAVAASDAAPAAPAASAPESEEESTGIRLNIPGSSASASKPAATSAAKAPTATPTPKPAATPAQAASANGKAVLNPAEIIVFFPPFYPLSQRMQGIEGRVDLDLAISEKGEVTQVKVLTATAPQFRDYAMAAAREWRFIPARLDGKPVALNVVFPVPFVSEFGSGDFSSNSPLARLTYIDGTFYQTAPGGRLTLANVEVTPLLRATPAFRQTEGETKSLRVVLNFTVDAEGQVKDPSVVESSNSGFDQAALTAVKYWQFLPQIRNGKPVSSKVKLPIVFGADAQAK